MSNWVHKGQVVTQEQIDETGKEYVGFIYLITNLVNDKKYIGQKKLWRVVTRPPLKGKTRKRKETKQSDWQTYYGSSEALKADLAIFGEENFKREIIYFCNSKAEMNYRETKLQFDNDVLFKPDEFYNGIINIRISRGQLRSKPVD